MDFNSIDEIVSHFNLDSKEVEEVKRELKNLIKQVHPDKNNGDFKGEKEKGTFYDIQSALEFLGDMNTSTSLATKKDITTLTTVLKDLALTRKKEVVDDLIEKKGISLTNNFRKALKFSINATPLLNLLD
jgi:curved DNA-binding protein CbpA